MLLVVDFGNAHAGIGTVGYKLLDADGTLALSRTTAGVYEIGGGKYAANVILPPGFVDGSVYWDTEEGGPVNAAEAIDASYHTVILPPEGLDAVEIEPGINLRQAVSVIGAMVSGLLTGAGDPSGIVTVYAMNGPGNVRVVMDTTFEGNRTSVILTPPV